MADVQVEHGYTRIADELLEAICAVKLSGRELQVLLSIIRLTYGFGKKSDGIAPQQVSNLTTIDKRNVNHLLNRLAARGIIDLDRKGVGRAPIVGVQKDPELWQKARTISVRVNSDTTDSVSILTPTCANSDTQPAPIPTASKENIDILTDKEICRDSKSPQGAKSKIRNMEAKSLAEYLRSMLATTLAGSHWTPPASLASWETEFGRMLRLDGPDRSGVPAETICEVISWLPSSEFWIRNCQSAKAVRKHFTRLHAEMRSKPKPRGGRKSRMETISENIAAASPGAAHGGLLGDGER